MGRGIPCHSNSFAEFPPMINKVDKNEIKMMMIKIMSMIMIENDACMSNMNSKCKSLILIHKVFVKKEKNKKKENSWGKSTYCYT